MVVRIFNSCVVLIVILHVCFGAIDAAAISSGPRSVDAFSPATKTEHSRLRIARQAYSDEDDSEEDDEVQAQNLAQQQQQQFPNDSQEESEEDGEEDRRRRRRRESAAAEAEKIEQSEVPVKESEAVAVPEPLPAPTPATSGQTDVVKEPEQTAAAAAPAAVTPATPSRNTSVLILIRDALKKVTTLPTEQVATNALHYFQLFEHFIQQAIVDVIGDDDDDDDEAAAAVAETTIKPDGIFTPEEEELIAGVEEILKEPELVTKQPQVVKPAETQMEVANQKPIDNETIVGSTKPVPGEPQPETVPEEKPAAIVVPTKVESAASSA